MLNPLANVAIYGFVFGILFGATAPAGENSGLTSFAYFMLCALLPWNFFALIINSGMGSISANSGLVRRVAFPREVLVFSNVIHALVQFSIELTLLVVILAFAGSPLLPYLPITAGLTVLLAVFGSGYALALSTLSVYFKDLNYLWAIVMQLWFFLTPIVYPPDLLEREVPEWGQNLLRLNPMVHFSAAFRDTLYHGRMPSAETASVVILSAVVSISIGWYTFYKSGRRLAEEV